MQNLHNRNLFINKNERTIGTDSLSAMSPEQTNSKQSNIAAPTLKDEKSPVFGYYDCAGIGEPIRMMLHYRGVEFHDRRYHNLAEWKEVRSKGDLAEVNLPYYYDSFTERLLHGDYREIMIYISENVNLMPQLEQREKAKTVMKMAENVLAQLYRVISAQPDEFKKLNDSFTGRLPSYVIEIETLLSENQFVCGQQIAYVDFFLYNLLISLRVYYPVPFANAERIKHYTSRIETLTSLQDYLHKRGTLRINPPGAYWEATWATHGPVGVQRDNERRKQEMMISRAVVNII